MAYCAGKHIDNWGSLNTTSDKPHFQWFTGVINTLGKLIENKRKDCKSRTEGN